MNAGLPGVGIAGLFFVVSALVVPLVELARTVTGRSSLERWRGVAHDWLLAVAMLAAFVAMGWVVVEKVPEPISRRLEGGVPTSVSAMAITFLVLAALLALTQATRLLRRPGRPPGSTRPSRRRPGRNRGTREVPDRVPVPRRR